MHVQYLCHTETQKIMKQKIRNNIQFTTMGGIEVEQAWLQFAEGGFIRTDENLINLDQKIKLHIISTGWTGANNLIKIGASEKITTDENVEILNVADLFEQYDFLPLETVRKISLSAIISNVDEIVNYFQVDFRIWNKNQEQEIRGFYRFII